MDKKILMKGYEFTREDYIFVEAVMSQYAHDLISKAEERKQELLRYKKMMSEDFEPVLDPMPMEEPITEEDEEYYAKQQREHVARWEEIIQSLLKEAEDARSLSTKAHMLHAFWEERRNEQ